MPGGVAGVQPIMAVPYADYSGHLGEADLGPLARIGRLFAD